MYKQHMGKEYTVKQKTAEQLIHQLFNTPFIAIPNTREHRITKGKPFYIVELGPHNTFAFGWEPYGKPQGWGLNAEKIITQKTSDRLFLKQRITSGEFKQYKKEHNHVHM